MGSSPGAVDFFSAQRRAPDALRPKEQPQCGSPHCALPPGGRTREVALELAAGRPRKAGRSPRRSWSTAQWRKPHGGASGSARRWTARTRTRGERTGGARHERRRGSAPSIMENWGRAPDPWNALHTRLGRAPAGWRALHRPTRESLHPRSHLARAVGPIPRSIWQIDLEIDPARPGSPPVERNNNRNERRRYGVRDLGGNHDKKPCSLNPSLLSSMESRGAFRGPSWAILGSS